MKILSTIVLALALMIVPATFAQHGHSGGHSSGRVPSTHGTTPRTTAPSRGPIRTGPRTDYYGRHYNQGLFTRDHAVRFTRNDGRLFNGYHEYFFGGFWFYYPQPWPAWFYNCDVYFGVDRYGFWYGYCATDPRLFVPVFID